MAISFKGAHFPRDHSDGDPLVRGVSAKHPSCRRTHEGTGVTVDHSTINRWVVSTVPSWRKRSTAANAQCGSAGGWTRRISR